MPAPLTEKSSQDFLQLFGCLYDSTFVHHQAERSARFQLPKYILNNLTKNLASISARFSGGF